MSDTGMKEEYRATAERVIALLEDPKTSLVSDKRSSTRRTRTPHFNASRRSAITSWHRHMAIA
jgi:hypothetical protein